MANIAGNASISRSLAVGYTDQRVPQANLDVKGNVYIDGNTHVRDQQIISFGTVESNSTVKLQSLDVETGLFEN